MKKIFFGLTLAAGLTLTSCSSFLEEPILGQQDMENYFATEDECANQVIGCYAYLACDDWWQIYKHYGLVDMCTDDEWMGNTTQEPGDYKPLSHYTGNTVEGGNAVQNFYQYRWKGILQCNIAIQKIPELTFNDESYKNRLIGEAKFLRAFMVTLVVCLSTRACLCQARCRASHVLRWPIAMLSSRTTCLMLSSICHSVLSMQLPIWVAPLRVLLRAC